MPHVDVPTSNHAANPLRILPQFTDETRLLDLHFQGVRLHSTRLSTRAVPIRVREASYLWRTAVPIQIAMRRVITRLVMPLTSSDG
jgi:hypothetical protein